MFSKIKVNTFSSTIDELTLEAIRYTRMGSIFVLSEVKYLLTKREIFNICDSTDKLYGYVKLSNFEGEFEVWFLPEGIKTRETEYIR